MFGFFPARPAAFFFAFARPAVPAAHRRGPAGRAHRVKLGRKWIKGRARRARARRGASPAAPKPYHATRESRHRARGPGGDTSPAPERTKGAAPVRKRQSSSSHSFFCDPLLSSRPFRSRLPRCALSLVWLPRSPPRCPAHSHPSALPLSPLPRGYAVVFRRSRPRFIIPFAFQARRGWFGHWWPRARVRAAVRARAGRLGGFVHGGPRGCFPARVSRGGA